jgi:hypothetical protein
MEEFIVFCTCIRSTTNTSLTIPLPPEVTADTMVDYIGNEFDWQFIPMGVQVIPANQCNIKDEPWK